MNTIHRFKLDLTTEVGTAFAEFNGQSMHLNHPDVISGNMSLNFGGGNLSTISDFASYLPTELAAAFDVSGATYTPSVISETATEWVIDVEYGGTLADTPIQSFASDSRDLQPNFSYTVSQQGIDEIPEVEPYPAHQFLNYGDSSELYLSKGDFGGEVAIYNQPDQTTLENLLNTYAGSSLVQVTEQGDGVMYIQWNSAAAVGYLFTISHFGNGAPFFTDEDYGSDGVDYESGEVEIQDIAFDPAPSNCWGSFAINGGYSVPITTSTAELEALILAQIGAVVTITGDGSAGTPWSCQFASQGNQGDSVLGAGVGGVYHARLAVTCTSNISSAAALFLACAT